jgi:putative ATPase
MILWGEPGCGKTSLAHVISRTTQCVFEPFSAVLGGVAELRELIAQAKQTRLTRGRGTVLFVDEIHRFNRAQQDAFLPHVENGSVVLIGATTENPSFAVNSALLSRSKVFRLESLKRSDIEQLLRRAWRDAERGLGKLALVVEDAAIEAMADAARGDARRGLTQLESLAEFAQQTCPEAPRIDLPLMSRYADTPALLYDKQGEEHYNVTSAFIKSMRGTDPDAAIYWLMRMLDAGDDPLFVLRRMIIFASEDVGNADPRALSVAVAADDAYRRIGMPEGLYPISQACLYLASCPKSNSVGKAYSAAREEIRKSGALPVPKKLRNAVTSLMRSDGYGEGYKYPHEFDQHVVPGEDYLPDELRGQRYYEPNDQGLELAIRQRLEKLRGKPQR